MMPLGLCHFPDACNEAQRLAKVAKSQPPLDPAGFVGKLPLWDLRPQG
jgi:hypothetical protein